MVTSVPAAELTRAFDERATMWELFCEMPEQDDDVEFYRVLADRIGGPATEYGVGVGRVAQAVRPDYGVDVSPEMLRYAADRLATTELFCADMREVRLPVLSKFSYVPMNTFNHLVDESSLSAALRNVRANSLATGVLAFDLFGPHYYRQVDERLRTVLASRLTDSWCRQAFYLRVGEEPAIYEHCSILEQLDEHGVVGSRRYLRPVRERAYPAEQIAKLLRNCGWAPLPFSEFDDINPYRDNPQKQVWVAQAAD